MTAAKALVLKGDGINCDGETAWALELVGFQAQSVHVSDLLQAPECLKQYQLLALPGGFAFGDEIASGKVLAVKLKERLNQSLYQFAQEDKLILGICNGFQVLVQLGMLPYSEPGRPRLVSLTRNRQQKFLNRWVKMTVSKQVRSPFFEGLNEIELPIRHGEGRLALEPEAWQTMEETEARQAAPTSSSGAYLNAPDHNANAETVKKFAPLRYNEDVNGSFDRIAALTNEKGNVLGLMPHPEAFVRPTQNPEWTFRRCRQRTEMSSLSKEAVQELAGRTNISTKLVSRLMELGYDLGKHESSIDRNAATLLIAALEKEQQGATDGLRIFQNAARYIGTK